MAKYRKLGRTSAQRKALLRNQVTALIQNGKIVTTQARAKEVQKQAEKLITMAIKEKIILKPLLLQQKLLKKTAKARELRKLLTAKK